MSLCLGQEGFCPQNCRLDGILDTGRTIESTLQLIVGDFFHIDVAGARAAGLADAVLFDPADLYGDAGCTRVLHLPELAPLVAGRNAASG